MYTYIFVYTYKYTPDRHGALKRVEKTGSHADEHERQTHESLGGATRTEDRSACYKVANVACHEKNLVDKHW